MSENEHVKPTAVAAQAYRELELLLVTLELEPASFVTEGALVERVGLGRTPVREAIQRLAWEGFIEVKPRLGMRIAPIDPADWPRVLEARRGIEIILASSAARNIDDRLAEHFQQAAFAMHDAVLAKDLLRFLDADKALDEALAAATDNQFAARLAAPLQTHSRRFWFRYRSPNALAESAASHVAVIQAILDRDPVAAGEQAAHLVDQLVRSTKQIK
jgi:DNA-binding GntR family transcriptional regulator